MIKRYTSGGPLNIPFYQSLVNGRLCDHSGTAARRRIRPMRHVLIAVLAVLAVVGTGCRTSGKDETDTQRSELRSRSCRRSACETRVREGTLQLAMNEGTAPEVGAGGRRFKSSHPDHLQFG